MIYFFLDFDINQNTITAIPTTAKIPTHTPALKIPSIKPQPDNAESINKRKML
jgi:hypothetical protein